ncbi:MAG: cobalt-precorrin-5B (C(1))-methyltransferase CbiD [Butyrivibrio sp.]|jgi:cobalt-precorrin-5B (C1)-methyltransferase|nr:cobalt-precorrin-5B (C(1))-methyltransferase CbiD [Butyrivibrio sp.]MCR4635365.1 cobalt-precorrin-5B (C(1))-methyltransferase CbiD [Butyrivibrio sp.]
MNDHYIEKSGKKLRYGFTTGSCAAAASKAALIMLITGGDIHTACISTPGGINFNAEIIDIHREEDFVSCAVVKDGGDDPDVTTGSKVCAKVTLTDNKGIYIDGGEGVGRVTKPGLDQPIGNAAINSVPRKMITENLESILIEYGIEDKGVSVIISVPNGETLAEKTFNPKLGIVGGISILGTTGIVEPMSDRAVIDTIRVETKVRKAQGSDILMVAPGNYGLSFLSEVYKIDPADVVLCSNFVYDAVNIAVDEGFSRLLFVGHIGKLVKVAGGIKNTHSMYGDHRMEILSDICKKLLDAQTYESIKADLMECVMTGEAVRIINTTGKGDIIFDNMAQSIKDHMQKWSGDTLEVEVIVFAGENEELVATSHAHEWIKEET